MTVTIKLPVQLPLYIVVGALLKLFVFSEGTIGFIDCLLVLYILDARICLLSSLSIILVEYFLDLWYNWDLT